MTLEITSGAETQFETGRIAHVATAQLSSTKVIVCYRDIDNAGQGTAVVLSISGTTITAGTPAVFETGRTNGIDVAALSSSKAIVTYQDDDDTDAGKAAVLDVTGTTVTPGTPATFEALVVGFTTVAALTSSKAMVAYRHTNDTSKGKARILDVSGTTITPGAAATFDNPAHRNSAGALTSSKVINLYWDNSPSTSVKAVILEQSNATVTPGTPATISTTNPTGAGQKRIAIIDSTKAVAVWQTTLNEIRARVLTITGTTITAGSELLLLNIGGILSEPQIAITSADRVMVVDAADDKVETLTIDGTTLTEDNNEFSLLGISDYSLVQIATSTIVAAYRKTSGDAVVLEINEPFPATFYQGDGVLNEKFDLPFFGVAPGGMALDKPLGIVAMAADGADDEPVVYSEFPYESSNANDDDFPVDAGTTSLKWVG